MSASPREADLTRGSVGRTLLWLAAPTLVASLAVVATQVVDTVLLARRGSAHLAAAGYGFPVLLGVVAAGMALAAGVSKVIAVDVGGGRTRAAARRTGHAVALALLGGAGVSLLVLGGSAALGAQGFPPLTRDHVALLAVHAPPLVLTMSLGASLRARGDARTPALALGGVALAHGALAVPLVLGGGPIPGWGARGAPLAGALAWSVGAVWLARDLRARSGLSWSGPLEEGEEPFGSRDSWRAILRVGGPAAVARAARPLLVAWVTALAAEESGALVAAYGAGGRLQALLALPALALAAALLPFVSQNRAARRGDRTRRGMGGGIGAVAGGGVVVWSLAAAGRRFVAALLASPGDVRDLLEIFLLLGLLSLPAEAVATVSKAGLHALERSRWVVLVGGGQLVVSGLGATLGLHVAGVRGLFLGMAAGQALMALAALATLARVTPGAARRGAPPGDR